MPLRPETIERVVAMWRTPSPRIETVSVVTIAGETLICAPPRILPRLAGVEPTRAAVLAALGPAAATVIGEARLAYADDCVLQLSPTDAVVRITDDDPRLATLAATADLSEWKESSVDEASEARFAFCEGARILAVATLGNWDNVVGSYGVFTDARARGHGLAAQVATAAIVETLRRELVPQWQSHVTNTASGRVADKLGFVVLGHRDIIRVRAATDGSRTMER